MCKLSATICLPTALETLFCSPNDLPCEPGGCSGASGDLVTSYLICNCPVSLLCLHELQVQFLFLDKLCFISPLHPQPHQLGSTPPPPSQPPPSPILIIATVGSIRHCPSLYFQILTLFYCIKLQRWRSAGRARRAFGGVAFFLSPSISRTISAPQGETPPFYPRATNPLLSPHLPPFFARTGVKRKKKKKKSGVSDPHHLHAVSPIPRHEFMDHGDVVAPRGSRSETTDAFQD